jgi:hypothetical protein
VTTKPWQHRLVKVTPARIGPTLGMLWDCSCGAVGWFPDDDAEKAWHDHTMGVVGLTPPEEATSYPED